MSSLVGYEPRAGIASKKVLPRTPPPVSVTSVACRCQRSRPRRVVLAAACLLTLLSPDIKVYAGSVSPSITLSDWEGMGLEERMTAVLSASSKETIAEDVRAFARAAAAERR